MISETRFQEWFLRIVRLAEANPTRAQCIAQRTLAWLSRHHGSQNLHNWITPPLKELQDTLSKARVRKPARKPIVGETLTARDVASWYGVSLATLKLVANRQWWGRVPGRPQGSRNRNQETARRVRAEWRRWTSEFVIPDIAGKVANKLGISRATARRYRPKP